MQPTDHSRNWGDLLAAARSGDVGALEQLLKHAREYLARQAAGRLPSDLQSKLGESDLVQKSLIDAADDFAQFRGNTEREYQVWLEGNLRHHSDDTKRQFLAVASRDARREVQCKSMKRIPDSIKTPSSIARHVETDEQLECAIAELPDNYQKVIEFRHEQGKSWDEVGELMEVSTEAARKLWARAIKKIQQKLVMQECDDV